MISLRSWIVTVLTILTTLSCSTGAERDTGEYSLTSVFGAVEQAMTMGIQNQSENKRVFVSRPFLVKQSEEVTKLGKRERGIATVTVLGDRRPYTIDVVVSIEVGPDVKGKNPVDGSKFKHARYDKRLGNLLLRSIMDTLESRERDRNVIDDFKPF